jgi:hypothetical protein
MHHHLAHEPYYDNTLPPEITQSIWANICRERGTDPALLLSDHASQSPPADGPLGREQDSGPPSSLVGNPKPLESPGTSSEFPDESSHLTEEVYQKRMRHHIRNLRDFCDGLEYQLPFNDFRMLHVLEHEGGRFLSLVRECLEKEGRLSEEVPSSNPREDSSAFLGGSKAT